jgi:hypothetical protein
MPNNILMRASFKLMLVLGLTACATPAVAPWQKSGADETTIAKDASDCRASAEREAVRRYPYGFGSASGASGMAMSQQHDEMDRSGAESSSFDSCMRNKGYTRASTQDK